MTAFDISYLFPYPFYNWLIGQNLIILVCNQLFPFFLIIITKKKTPPKILSALTFIITLFIINIIAHFNKRQWKWNGLCKLITIKTTYIYFIVSHSTIWFLLNVKINKYLSLQMITNDQWNVIYCWIYGSKNSFFFFSTQFPKHQFTSKIFNWIKQIFRQQCVEFKRLS